jgi:hypothetical protein
MRPTDRLNERTAFKEHVAISYEGLRVLDDQGQNVRQSRRSPSI